MEAKLIKRSDVDYKLYVNEATFATSIESPYKRLSLKNCQAIERDYDLDELKDEFISNQLNGLDKESREKYYSFAEDDANSFIKGFQKALEILGDKKVFISKDTYEHYLHQQKLQDNNSKNPLSGKVEELKNIAFHGNYLFNNLMEELTKSVLQQTEWEVEIEMECVMGCQNLLLNGENSVCCGDKKPKLDVNNCLILKRVEL